MFDFSNHTWKDANMAPRASWPVSGKGIQISRRTSNDLTCETLDRKVEEHEELLLTYGSHANTRLFVEYGFVNAVPEENILSGAYPGEINVDEVVINLAETKEGKQFISEMKAILEAEGYWRCVGQPLVELFISRC